MTMLTFFYIVIGINAFIALCYLLWGFICVHNKEHGRLLCFIRFMVMIVCPVIGILYFVCSNLFHKLFFHKDVDLSAVIFNKEKIRQVERSDMEREINFAPIEEAIAVSDYKNQRQLMMNVLRSDIRSSLGSISLALNSEDSEVSHYAASALRDELGDFRSTVLKMQKNLHSKEQYVPAECCRLIEYMHPVLIQEIFPEPEHKGYVLIFEEAVSTLYNSHPDMVKNKYYEWLIDQLLLIHDTDAAKKWCDIVKNRLKEQLTAYKCLLKFYYTTQNSRLFFETMQELKQSDIPIDNDTLEILRTFS